MLVESDLFIAIIKEKDRFKHTASGVIEDVETGKLIGAYASVAVIQEVVFWLLREKRQSDILKTVNALSSIKNLEWVDLSKRICLNATALIEEYKLSPFDAYHAATAISKDRKILSSDHVFDMVKGIERIELKA